MCVCDDITCIQSAQFTVSLSRRQFSMLRVFSQLMPNEKFRALWHSIRGNSIYTKEKNMLRELREFVMYSRLPIVAPPARCDEVTRNNYI